MPLPKPKHGEPTAVVYSADGLRSCVVPLEYANDLNNRNMSYNEFKAKWFPEEKVAKQERPKEKEKEVRHRPDCPTLKQARKELVSTFVKLFG